MPNSFRMIISEAIDSGTLHYKEEFLESGCFLNAENNLWFKAKTIKNGAARLCWLVSTSLISCTSQKKQLPCVFLKVKILQDPRTLSRILRCCPSMSFQLSSNHYTKFCLVTSWDHQFCINISMCLWGNLVLLPFLRYCWLDKHSSTCYTQTGIRYPNQFLNFKT